MYDKTITYLNVEEVILQTGLTKQGIQFLIAEGDDFPLPIISDDFVLVWDSNDIKHLISGLRKFCDAAPSGKSKKHTYEAAIAKINKEALVAG